MTVATFFTSFLQAVANDGGIILLFIFIGVTGWRRVWIWGAELKRMDSHLKDEQVRHMGELSVMREERDSWRRIALYQQSRSGPTPPPEGD